MPMVVWTLLPIKRLKLYEKRKEKEHEKKNNFSYYNIDHMCHTLRASYGSINIG